jgi:D-alanyl-lipoteichoic acid acyltransferase DltB (MBOAT superfamily)
MIFTSYDFLLFFLVVFSAYWLLKRRLWQNLFLLAASYVFYGWVHPWYALLLGLSTLADYFLALGMARNRARIKWFMAASLIINLGVLGFFKYYNFFNEGLANLLTGMRLNADPLLVQILLPAGLSFYTLKKMAYVIDVARGTLEPTRDLAGFALFVSFFPQITSGPIDRAQKLLPQIQSERAWKAENFYSAWPLIVMGFFKKVVVADTIRTLVDRIYGLESASGLLILSAALAFTLQILADFSAYTDLARGVAYLFGFETTENFRQPYLATTPTDFWNRWHITLSTWLRDYIFFPLRRALLRSKIKLPAWIVDSVPPLVTMLASGIWHGAGWTYAAWGGFFGLLIVAYQTFGLGGAWKPSHWLTRFAAWLVMFSFIVLSFIIFRAPSLAWTSQLFTNPFAGTLNQQAVAVVCLSMTAFYASPLIIKLVLDRFFRPDRFIISAFYAAATVMMFLYLNSSSPDFIYFQF